MKTIVRTADIFLNGEKPLEESKDNEKLARQKMNRDSRKGKTYEEIYGIERAKIERKKRSDTLSKVLKIKLNEKRVNGWIPSNTGKTWEEHLGPEKARKAKEKLSKSQKKAAKRRKKNGYVSPQKGKTYKDLYGDQWQEEIDRRVNTRIKTVRKRKIEGKYVSPKKGKTYEELYGNRAEEEKKKRRESFLKTVENGWTHPKKGKTLEERYGKDKAKEIKENISKGKQKMIADGWISPWKGLTYEEIYGHDNVEEEIRKRQEFFKCHRKNSPWIFMGIHFSSKEEMMVAKMLNKNLGFIPIDEVNTHVTFDGAKEMDFLIYGFVFEYHPMNYPLEPRTNRNDYYNERREKLDNSEYKNYPLIHLTNFKEAEKMLEILEGLDYERLER